MRLSFEYKWDPQHYWPLHVRSGVVIHNDPVLFLGRLRSAISTGQPVYRWDLHYQVTDCHRVRLANALGHYSQYGHHLFPLYLLLDDDDTPLRPDVLKEWGELSSELERHPMCEGVWK